MHLSLLIYGLPLVFIWAMYGRRRGRRHRSSLAIREAALEAGLVEPPSLHPVIDPSRCLGCASCVKACPESNVLGLVGGKAELVNPSSCIGHGACQLACPFDAISLVFGTETRGVDIPLVSSDFETNVPGIFIAGELGGMGLIRNGIEQGRQAVESVRGREGVGRGEGLDLVIVGAGPAGFAASLAALQHGLRFATLEQETLGGTVAHYPRGKIVMTAPVDLPLYGKVKLKETTKESLLRLWRDVEQKTGVEIQYGERVEHIAGCEGGFEVKSSRRAYRCRSVLLAIGRRGTPRKLEVQGEDSTKVVYRLVDPEQYRGQRVLVVGGGDSALEAALALSEVPGTEATLSYRGDAFSRAKAKNRARVEAAAREGLLRVLLGSAVSEILPSAVRLATGDGLREIPNDAVVACAGGVLPTAFLRSIGIEVETRHGTA